MKGAKRKSKPPLKTSEVTASNVNVDSLLTLLHDQAHQRPVIAESPVAIVDQNTQSIANMTTQTLPDIDIEVDPIPTVDGIAVVAGASQYGASQFINGTCCP